MSSNSDEWLAIQPNSIPIDFSQVAPHWGREECTPCAMPIRTVAGPELGLPKCSIRIRIDWIGSCSRLRSRTLRILPWGSCSTIYARRPKDRQHGPCSMAGWTWMRFHARFTAPTNARCPSSWPALPLPSFTFSKRCKDVTWPWDKGDE